jgi:hypothetical protein
VQDLTSCGDIIGGVDRTAALPALEEAIADIFDAVSGVVDMEGLDVGGDLI